LLISTARAVLVEKFAVGVVETDGKKFSIDVIDTDGAP
jgi:hypothetical protein